MSPNCIAAVQQAAGRALTPAQIKAIDDRIVATMRRLAVKDPQTWRAMPRDDRVLAGATQAMQDIQDEAARKLANTQRQIVKTAETNNRITQQRQSYGSTHSAALVRDIENTQHYIDGVKNDYVREMLDLVEAGQSGQGAGIGRRALMALFDADNPQMSRDLAHEIFGNAKGSTGNKIAQKAAQAWLETIEAMRTRFNTAGGNVWTTATCRSRTSRAGCSPPAGTSGPPTSCRSWTARAT
jgi:hydrogenase maturation factor